MLQSFLHSLIQSNTLWLICAALGVLILSLCMVIASVMMRESEEPSYGAARPMDDKSEIIV